MTTQLVLMTLQPGEEIGLEKHAEHDQFIRIEAGTGVVVLDRSESRRQHRVFNLGSGRA